MWQSQLNIGKKDHEKLEKYTPKGSYQIPVTTPEPSV